MPRDPLRIKTKICPAFIYQANLNDDDPQKASMEQNYISENLATENTALVQGMNTLGIDKCRVQSICHGCILMLQKASRGMRIT